MSTCDIHQAADLLKIHPETVLDLIAKCVIPAAKVGRSYVMLESDVLAYLTQQITQQTAERMGGTPLPKKSRRSPQLVRQVGAS